MAPTSTPIKDRLNRIRALRDAPRPLYPAKPTPMSPFVRAARAGHLRPQAIGFAPDGCGPTGRAA